ncbi:hypothetical protein BDZ89DRAFT_1197720 [Hymenopellis radicata]|nr:hypothetical protein BDZ89DRAFT_1197720 [Hymenopellis radicata]
MTRVTNFGRKRTYIETGLSEVSASDLTAEVPETKEAEETATTEGAEPLKKKRKRTKKKVDEAGGDPAASSSTKSQKPKKIKTDRKEATESRRQKRIAEREADTTCFACREKGHAARHCPKTKNEGGKREVGICYRCGSNKHTLSRCKKPQDPTNPLPFASCFVCSGKGHLASACPENKARGVYPNGGCCKLCGETSHLARNCGLRNQDLTHNPSVFVVDEGARVGADEDGFHVFKRTTFQVENDEKRLTKMVSQKLAGNAPPPKKVTKVVNFWYVFS